MNRKLIPVLVVALAALALAGATAAQNAFGGQRSAAVAGTPLGTAFSYQGRLRNSGAPVSGACDLRFGLWDAAAGGAQMGVTQTLTAAAVTGGLFNVALNGAGEFGANAFSGEARWLQTAVRCPAGSGAYTALAPRQPLTAVPYALYAVTAEGLAHSPYEGLLVVAPSGGDFTSIQAALDSVTGSSEQRYLIWVAPGTYTETVVMEPYVDIEGAGELLTVITAPGSGSPAAATLLGADNAELREITVENTGGAAYAVAIANNSASPRLTHVTAVASGGTTANTGVRNSFAAPVLTDVTAQATGAGASTNYGIYSANAAQPQLTATTAGASGGNASYGLYNNNAAPVINQVTAGASNAVNVYGVYNTNVLDVAFLNLTVTATGGTNAYGIYNDAADVTLMDASVQASGTTFSAGVYNNASLPNLTNVTAAAVTSGIGGSSYGCYNDGSDPSLIAVTLSASVATGGSGYGLYNLSSAPYVQDSTLGAQGGSAAYGVYNTAPAGAYVVKLNNSTITGATNTVRNNTGFITRVGASQLAGGPVNTNGGTITCIGVYDENHQSPGYNICP